MKRTRRRWRTHDIVVARERRERRRAAFSIMCSVFLAACFIAGVPGSALVVLLFLPVMAWMIWIVL